MEGTNESQNKLRHKKREKESDESGQKSTTLHWLFPQSSGYFRSNEKKLALHVCGKWKLIYFTLGRLWKYIPFN